MTRPKGVQRRQDSNTPEAFQEESKWQNVTLAHNYQNASPKDDFNSQTMMQHKIISVHADVKAIERFYDINFSRTRLEKVVRYLEAQLTDLKNLSFDKLDQEAKVDYILLRNWIRRNLAGFRNESKNIEEMSPLLTEWTFRLVDICEKRQRVEEFDPETLAGEVTKAANIFKRITEEIKKGNVKAPNDSKQIAFRAAKTVDELRTHVSEMFNFYNMYDPLFTWWMAVPYKEIDEWLENYSKAIREHLVGINPEDETDEPIIGDPVGHQRLMANLEAEFIPYTPEDLLKIGELEYEETMKEMLKASYELGYGKHWLAALEQVKTMFVPPGEQPRLIHRLAHEAISYVKQHNLVTVSPICEESWRTLMMSPKRQKVSPFFLGGNDILVAYPTSSMPQEDKLMSMRGNSKPFSKATVFHELIPGHHLQYHHMARDRPYRSLLFGTPFWIEGWAMYWEYVLWDRGDFFVTPEDRIGTLFWRLHRCARIIFSVNFHLGKWTPQKCIDFLVEKVGHERATAEGEVRRSFNGDYPPLYQAGYMLGALQLRELRREVVDGGRLGEKDFHDRILKGNQMPIEMVRALLVNRPLNPEYKSSWRFYHRHKP